MAEQSTSTNNYFSGVYFEMTNDIDLNGGEVLISTFGGNFDGKEYTIKNLTISQSNTDNVGLFGTLNSGGKVQNLTLENVNITGYTYAGGVVARNYGTVTACSVSGSVSSSRANYSAGGVVGRNWGTVTDCYIASGSVSSSSAIWAGGVVGRNGGTVIACYNASGTVSGTRTNSFVGGVVARTTGSNATMTACYNASGSISSSYSTTTIGGVVGYRDSVSGALTACYWSEYSGRGIGGGSGTTTKVDGEDVTWSDAVEGMNGAIDTWNTENTDKQCEWKYALTGSLPTLTKNE